MLFFLGLRLLLSKQPKDKGMGRGKRSRKRSKYNWQENDDQRTVKDLTAKTKRPFEDIKLPPPRDAQRKPENN